MQTQTSQSNLGPDAYFAAPSQSILRQPCHATCASQIGDELAQVLKHELDALGDTERTFIRDNWRSFDLDWRNKNVFRAKMHNGRLYTPRHRQLFEKERVASMHRLRDTVSGLDRLLGNDVYLRVLSLVGRLK